ncbi:MAG: hypothetical protein K8J08_07550, partial [Thermoanaerobaculia bacterium]|nr:hypothetical protein [Thermoanaerobaculia bacterium]
MSRLRSWMATALGATFLAFPGPMEAAQCGSALLLEIEAPSVFDSLDPTLPVQAHFWEAGAGGANRSDVGCQAGCTFVTGPLCAASGDCLALTGVNWLNANCASAGHRPSRTVFVAEQATIDSGGRWAAINLDRNADDANTDLDAKAAAVCGGCASTASPLLGGAGMPSVSNPNLSGAHLTVDLAWFAPSAPAQALSNGTNILTSYSLHYKIHAAAPPSMTGDPAGWIRTPDLDADGGANGGHSTNTSASIDVALPAGSWFITFAVGLNFDGTGDPMADANTRPSKLLSDQSSAVQATVDSEIFS